MIDKIKLFIVGLVYENNEPSLTRVIALLAFLAFLAGSAYLLITGKSWNHYNEFATMTGGGGAVTQIANKFLNLSKGSPAEQPYLKNNQGEIK